MGGAGWGGVYVRIDEEAEAALEAGWKRRGEGFGAVEEGKESLEGSCGA